MTNNHKISDLRIKISNTIAKRIVSGEYKEKELLPREVDFCNEFSVGRSSIREALRVLSTCGLITPISGFGTQVNEYKNWNLLEPRVLSWILESPEKKDDFINHLLNLRLFIEPHVIELAVVNATSDQILEIKTHINKMEASINNASEYTNADAEFHASIFRASGNPLWVSFSNLLLFALTKFLTISYAQATEDLLHLSLKRHKSLYNAISNRDLDKAKKITNILLEQIIKEFKQK